LPTHIIAPTIHNMNESPIFTVLHETTKSSLTKCKFDNPTLMQLCIDDVKDKLLIKPPIYLYNKTLHQRRDVAFFSNTSRGYEYSGQIATSQPLSTSLTTLLETVNAMFGASFNGILVNRYDDGENYISAHSDDERNLDAVGVVAISVGQTRTFRIREKDTKKIVIDVEMEDMDIIHMRGEFQKEFTHEIPPTKKALAVRYSFTFRNHRN
jgi:alkylated DNA repair dioxygenase AlkB